MCSEALVHNFFVPTFYERVACTANDLSLIAVWLSSQRLVNPPNVSVSLTLSPGVTPLMLQGLHRTHCELPGTFLSSVFILGTSLKANFHVWGGRVTALCWKSCRLSFSFPLAHSFPNLQETHCSSSLWVLSASYSSSFPVFSLFLPPCFLLPFSYVRTFPLLLSFSPSSCSVLVISLLFSFLGLPLPPFPALCSPPLTSSTSDFCPHSEQPASAVCQCVMCGCVP